MSKIGRNDPCPSGAEGKFKKCLRRHPHLGPQSTPGEIWWVCGRWQASEPDFGEVYDAWLRTSDPRPDKVERLFERIFGEPDEPRDWPHLLEQGREKQHPALPGLYRRMHALLSAAENPDLGSLQSTAAEIFREDHPEMYEEILAATIALDPAAIRMKSLESIVSWALERDRPEDCDRLRERFPSFPEYMLNAPDDSEEDEMAEPIDLKEEKKTEAKYPLEIEHRLDTAWDEFNDLGSPTPDDAEALVETLLALPHEATNWCDLFDIVREAKHPDLFRIFDRLISMIGTPGGNDLSFMAWGAMEEAVRRNERERLPEIARSLLQLDAANFDAGAVSHMEDYLLADGFVDECLALKEYVHPVLSASDDLMGWVVPRSAVEILALRLGRLVASGGPHGTDAEPILAGLVAGIEDEIDVKLPGRLIRRLLDGPDRTEPKSELLLPLDGDPVDRQQEHWVDLHTVFVAAAKSHGEAGGDHPARTLIGLQMIERAARHWIETRQEKKRKFRCNLLDYLDPHNIERQVAGECQEFLGTNFARVRTMLDAHKALVHWAEREGAPLPFDAGRILQKIDELLAKAGK